MGIHSELARDYPMVQSFSSRNNIRLFIILASLWLATNLPLHAQPKGETISGTVHQGDYQYSWTGREFSFHETGLRGVVKWTAPAGREIRGFAVKNSQVAFILLDDGSVYEMVYIEGGFGWDSPLLRSKTDPSNNYSGFQKLAGDALYALSPNGIFVSRDTAGTWTLDTAGVGAGFYNDFAVDTLQYVYLAHANGLFMQHPDSSVWHKVANFPGGSATSVFVDRNNRVYAATYGAIYLSTDGGGTWTSKTIGFTGGSVSHFCDDAFHNVYVLGGAKAFRSDSGTASWVRIDTAITNLIHDPINSYASPFTSIAGDSVLLLGTTYGLFQSTDRGTTWSEDNGDFPATTLYGYARSGTMQFETTALGLYDNTLGDTLWTKTFPATGYQTGGPIYVDNVGTLYSLGPIVNANNSQSPNSNWKSSDNGISWQPDTAGLGALAGGSIPKYLADENGIQHYAVSGIPAQCYVKNPGSSWIPDTAGWWRTPANYPNIFFSDGRGYLYLAITSTTTYAGLLLKRPVAGGSWVFDTAGLQGAIIYNLSVNAAGNLYAGTWGGGIYKRTGSTWAPISIPGGLQGNNAFVTAVDPSGALFAGFSYQSGFNYAWQGVYYTTNDGGSWTKVGLDSIAVRQLIAYGDSIYAVTYYDGLYVLTRNGATAVNRIASLTPVSFALFQNYPNPFNPTTTIRFSIGKLSMVNLKIFDLLGREVETLVEGPMEAGVHEVTFDATRFASGIYFYRVKAGTFSATKKLLLLK